MLEMLILLLAIPTALKLSLFLAAFVTVKRYARAVGDPDRILNSRPYRDLLLGFHCALATVALIAVIWKITWWSPATLMLAVVSSLQAVIAWREFPSSDPLCLDIKGNKLVMSYESERAKLYEIKIPKFPRASLRFCLVEVAILLLMWVAPALLRPFPN